MLTQPGPFPFISGLDGLTARLQGEMEEFLSLMSHPEVAVLNRVPLPGGGGGPFLVIVIIYLVCLRTTDVAISKKQQRQTIETVLLLFLKASLQSIVSCVQFHFFVGKSTYGQKKNGLEGLKC